jgi:hypothetical protein
MTSTWSCSCGRQWSGLTQAHCSVCHEHFSRVANFDKHGVRRGGCPHPSKAKHRKKDGTVVPLLKPVDTIYGVMWVSWSDDTRYTEDDEGQPVLNVEGGVA